MPGPRNVSEERRKMLLEEPLIKIIPKLAIPTIVAQLVTAFYGLADTFFVSQLGDAATAAVGINDSLSHFIQAIGLGFGAGALSYISRLLGAKKDDEANTVASTVFDICAAVSIVFSIVCFVLRGPLVDMLGATDTSKPYAIDYATFILFGTPFVAATYVLNSLLRAEGSNQFAMWGTVCGCVINIALDPLFISVMKMEVAGAALATAISQFVSFCVLMFPYVKKHTMIRINLRNFKPSWAMMGEVIKMGLPSFLRNSVSAMASTVTNNVAGAFGDFALAGMSVSNKIMKFLEAVTMGYATGIQPVVGFSWGAKKYRRVKKTYFTIAGVGSLIALVLGLVAAIFAHPLLSLFARSPEALDMGIRVFQLQCYVLVLHMVVISSSGFFQALGRAPSALFITFTRTLIILVPVTLILPNLFGLEGLIWVRAATDIISFLITLPLILKILHEINQKIAAGESTDDPEPQKA